MAADYFLKIDGIPGEALDAKHKGEIELMAWSWGETQSGSASSGTGGGTGKVNMQDFSFTMPINKASPHLFINCANGTHIKTAELTCRKAGGNAQVEYLKILFTGVLISSFQTGGSGGDSLPIESITFNFATIKYTYVPQKADGSADTKIEFAYDLKQSKKV